MKIEHIAFWVKDLEAMRLFYETYFLGISGKKYYNPHKNFSSYFLHFESGARLELMHKPMIDSNYSEKNTEYLGITHLAFSVGSPEKVDTLTEKLRKDGYRIVGEARTTGDGYYESVVLDPEGNQLEITL
jgi:lactoylglutathione lyase